MLVRGELRVELLRLLAREKRLGTTWSPRAAQTGGAGTPTCRRSTGSGPPCLEGETAATTGAHPPSRRPSPLPSWHFSHLISKAAISISLSDFQSHSHSHSHSHFLFSKPDFWFSLFIQWECQFLSFSLCFNSHHSLKVRYYTGRVI